MRSSPATRRVCISNQCWVGCLVKRALIKSNEALAAVLHTKDALAIDAAFVALLIGRKRLPFAIHLHAKKLKASEIRQLEHVLDNVIALVERVSVDVMPHCAEHAKPDLAHEVFAILGFCSRGGRLRRLLED
ncbi:hypothetical protein D9M72_590160 [compost metagenome]